MPTLQETIYPRLKSVVSSQDLERVYTPTPEECALAAQLTQDAVAYLGFLIYLKTFQRLGYFVRLHAVPDSIVRHIAQCVDRTDQIPQLPAYDHAGSSRRHQARIRAYRGVKPFGAGGLQVIQRAIADAANHTEQLDDLINRAIEELLRQYYELPGFTTLLKEAQRQRAKTYTTFYQQVLTALTPERQALLDALFVVPSPTDRSAWDQLKDPTGRPTLTHLGDMADRLAWFDPYQDLIPIVAGFPDAKRQHFATEAMAYDRAIMVDMKPPRRYTLACAFLASHYARTLDDLTEMFIKRIRAIQHDAKEALQTYGRQHQARTDALVTALRDVVVRYQQEGSAETRFAAIDAVLHGRSATLLQDCEAHLTYAGNNFAPFLWQFYRSHRATVFRLLTLLPLRAASQDTALMQALAFLLAHARSKGDWVSITRNDEPALDLSWIPVGWWRLVTDLPTRDQVPQRVNRRHFEACVVSQLLTALPGFRTSQSHCYSRLNTAELVYSPYPSLCEDHLTCSRRHQPCKSPSSFLTPTSVVLRKHDWSKRSSRASLGTKLPLALASRPTAPRPNASSSAIVRRATPRWTITATATPTNSMSLYGTGSSQPVGLLLTPQVIPSRRPSLSSGT
jgi:hypothetical protein